MDKKVVQNKCQSIVDQIVRAHGKNVDNKDDQTMGRSLFYLAISKNEAALVAATNPEPLEESVES